jgi:hypothetical protein
MATQSKGWFPEIAKVMGPVGASSPALLYGLHYFVVINSRLARIPSVCFEKLSARDAGYFTHYGF